jgi:hypothetical protein
LQLTMDDDITMQDDVTMHDEEFFTTDDRQVIEAYGRLAFTASIIALVPPPSLHSVSTTSVSSTTSLTPEKRQLKRKGFTMAKKRLYSLLQQLGVRHEMLTGSPLQPGQQEAAHMVASSAQDDFVSSSISSNSTSGRQNPASSTRIRFWL